MFRLLVLGLLGLPVARAHDPGISSAEGQARQGVLELRVGFSPLDIQQLLPPRARSSDWTEVEFEKNKGLLLEIGRGLIDLRSGGTRVAPRDVQVRLAGGDR